MTEHIESIRAFNRFYTRQIGLLEEGLLNSPFSLTECRVLYELAHRDRPTAAQISSSLRIQTGISESHTREVRTPKTAAARDVEAGRTVVH